MLKWNTSRVIKRAGQSAGAGVVSSGGGGYEGPLDIVSGAAVAYSANRALSAAMLGQPVFTVIRYADTNTQSFSSDAVTGEVDSASVNTFLGGSGGACQLWNDQSGNGIDAEELNLQQGPQWLIAGLNSLPTFDFSVGDGIITSSAVALPNGAYTVIAVVKQDGGVGNQGIFSNGFSGVSPYLDVYINTAVPELYVEAYQELPEEAYTYATFADAGFVSQTYLVAVSWASGSKLCKLNGATVSPSASDDVGVVDSVSEIMAIGARSLTGEDGLVGTISELIVYPTNLSEANLNLVSQNIATFYGITLS